MVKNIFAAIGALSTLVALIVGCIEIIKFSNGESPASYKKDWIPIVYTQVSDFKKFLQKNDGKVVNIKSSLALDAVLPVNLLIHEFCEIDLPPNERGNTKKVYNFGLATFSPEFKEENLEIPSYNEKTKEYNFPENVKSMISCQDKLRVELINPESFRMSYGGTGSNSIPISGNFRVTLRFFSGPRAEYTLRQISE